MIAYVTVGTTDLARAKRFYTAFLPALGYRLDEGPEGLSFTFQTDEPQTYMPPDFYVKTPFDGQPPTAGNGAMVAFEAQRQAEVRALHAAALAAGGHDAGAPGFRAAYSPRFYVGYLRDPDGNKIAVFSSNPDEPDREASAAL